MRRAAQLPVVLVFLCAAFVLTACRPRGRDVVFDPSDPAAAAARLERHLKRRPGDDDAWRDLAHIYWLYLGQPERARPIIARLAKGGDFVAMLSAMVMADARLDNATAQKYAYGLVASAAKYPEGRGGRGGPFARAAAEVAARQIARDHGDLGGDDDRFIALYDSLDLERLPYSVQQPLISNRAAIARRRDRPYKAYFEREGCVQDWAAGPLLGTLGDQELALQPRGPFQVDPEAKVVPLSCVVRVWNPTRRTGIRRLQSHLAVVGDELLLDVSAEESIRVYVDGTLIHRTDVASRYPSRRRRFSLAVAPGEHTLEIATAIGGENAWVLVRATEADGRPVQSRARGGGASSSAFRGKAKLRRPPWPDPMQGVTSEIYAPLRNYLAVDAALADGESDLAEQLVGTLAKAEAFAEGQLLRARFERADPTRTASVSAAREQKALEAALAVDPSLDAARLRLLSVMLERGDDAEVARELEGLPKDHLRGIHGEMFRYRAQRARGSEHLALAALDRAEALHPGSCEISMARRSLARERDDVRAEDALAVKLADCGGSTRIRARLAETRGRPDEAEQLWAKLLARAPDDVEALEGLARIAAANEKPERAKERLQQVLALNPYRVGANVGLADLAAAAGDLDAARGELRAALERLPHSDAVRMAGASLGLPDDLMTRFRVDGRDALASYQASGIEYPGVSEVLVLDRSVARVYDNGGQRQIVHLVVHLLSKEALDRYGEIQIPDGARLLRLRSIKPDGRTFEPEIVPGKDGVELRKLEVGDFVEYEFVVETDPAVALPSYVDVSTFRFQSLDIPYHRSELIVVAPASMPLQVDRRNAPPEPTRETITTSDGRKLAVTHYRAEQVPRLGVEPGHRVILEEVPNVRVYTDLDVQRWLIHLAGNLRYAQRANPELRRRVRRLVAGKETDDAKLRALWTWVVENVEDGGDLSSPATATLAGRAGNRLMLLRAMLRVAGIDSELWLARDAYGPPSLPGGHPMVENYDAAILSVRLPGAADPVMVMTSSKVMPLGYLTPGYAAAAALRVPLDPGEGVGAVKVPGRAPELVDRRRWSLAIALDRAGSGTVEGTISLQGMEAVLWRQALRDLDRDRIEEVFQQAELGWLRGATLTRLDIRHEKALGKPLELAFSARAPEVAITQGGALVMRSSPVPLNQGARFTSLPKRVTGMVVPYAPIHEAHIEVTLDGARFVDVPEDATIESEFGRWSRKVERSASRVAIELRSELKTGVVEPTAYERLAEFTRKVETATGALLTARPG